MSSVIAAVSVALLVIVDLLVYRYGADSRLGGDVPPDRWFGRHYEF